MGSSHVPWAADVAEKKRCCARTADVVRAGAVGRNNVEATVAGLVENVRAEEEEEAAEREDIEEVVVEVMLRRWKAWRSMAAPGMLDGMVGGYGL